ncbi:MULTISPECIES: hypothetical protein [Rhodopseudomonas]|uniref:PepSY domain-containing protein n=1 Tax=Rhodopseudomonas palustris TaxID=1076 RepID=A0A0D7EIK4_RHOPL|nr:MULTISPECIES: hypothetical protein [Rhodopseudomonas]KIZ39317.1 hypothetical protein OO17_20755 [Rhodopseudomonas palustris]MDF3810910.1 hypothetical protein [Rhodopseudomonas sp. BAL398]WOK19889.1 hypothetical protein RBJ75_10370 [Rhodopseudomonas sp. BAL398]
MSRLAITAALLSLALAGPVCAQTAAPAAPAAKVDLSGPAKINDGPLATGENTLTEKQAKRRLMRSGLSNVSDLVLDDKGIWRGRAERSGINLNVGVDRLGNLAIQ